MKQFHVFVRVFLLIAITALFSLSSCDSTESDDDNPTPQDPQDPITIENKNAYSGAASIGDLITFTVDTDNQSIELSNETHNETASFSYTEMTDEFSSLYEFNIANEGTYFGLELSDKIAAAVLPIAAKDAIVYGVTSELDNSAYVNNIPGDYVYIRLGDYDGLPDGVQEYGAFTLKSDGQINLVFTYTNRDYELFNIANDYGFPLETSNFFGNEFELTGSWSVDGSKKDRFVVTLENNTYTGYAYADNTTSVFLIDLGPNNGLAIAYKITSTSLSSIAGTYKYIGIDDDETAYAGNITLKSNGSADFVRLDDKNSKETFSFSGLSPITGYGNVYEAELDNGSFLTLVAVGDVLMFFQTTNSGELEAYSAAAKID